jgi:hypothetical protein
MTDTSQDLIQGLAANAQQQDQSTEGYTFGDLMDMAKSAGATMNAGPSLSDRLTNAPPLMARPPVSGPIGNVTLGPQAATVVGRPTLGPQAGNVVGTPQIAGPSTMDTGPVAIKVHGGKKRGGQSSAPSALVDLWTHAETSPSNMGGAPSAYVKDAEGNLVPDPNAKPVPIIGSKKSGGNIILWEDLPSHIQKNYPRSISGEQITHWDLDNPNMSAAEKRLLSALREAGTKERQELQDRIDAAEALKTQLMAQRGSGY